MIAESLIALGLVLSPFTSLIRGKIPEYIHITKTRNNGFGKFVRIDYSYGLKCKKQVHTRLGVPGRGYPQEDVGVQANIKLLIKHMIGVSLLLTGVLYKIPI